MNPSLPSKTAKTMQHYRMVAGRLWEKAASELQVPSDNLTTEEFVNWLVAKKGEWSPATWRQYHSACSFAFRDRYEKAIKSISLPDSGKRRQRTSGLKIKRLPPQDLNRLLQHLSPRAKNPANPNGAAKPKGVGYFAASSLLMGVITGLRPCEWPNAILIEPTEYQPLSLRVRNAKTTNGRSHGASRTIGLPDLPQHLVGMLCRHLKIVRHFVGQGIYERRVESARRAIHRANQALWPNRHQHYTLYSARHQSAANWKQYLSQEEIAALMGHASSATASTHYGRRSSGQSKILPKHEAPLPLAAPAEVARVKKGKGQRPQRSANPPAIFDEIFFEERFQPRGKFCGSGHL